MFDTRYEIRNLTNIRKTMPDLSYIRTFFVFRSPNKKEPRARHGIMPYSHRAGRRRNVELERNPAPRHGGVAWALARDRLERVRHLADRGAALCLGELEELATAEMSGIRTPDEKTVDDIAQTPKTLQSPCGD